MSRPAALARCLPTALVENVQHDPASSTDRSQWPTFHSHAPVDIPNLREHRAALALNCATAQIAERPRIDSSSLRPSTISSGTMTAVEEDELRPEDDAHRTWKRAAAPMYDWLTNHHLVWPSLACRCVAQPEIIAASKAGLLNRPCKHRACHADSDLEKRPTATPASTSRQSSTQRQVRGQLPAYMRLQLLRTQL